MSMAVSSSCGYQSRMHTQPATTHNTLIGYLFWIFGFTGALRFYYDWPDLEFILIVRFQS